MLRIEDTDKKREVEGSAKQLVYELKKFNITPEEGVVSDTKEVGVYGPYTQSKREYIYKVCAKELIKKGLAYPCFCTTEELDVLHKMQEKNKMIPGYYGVHAKCRSNSVETMIKKIEEGKAYIIRFRSQGNHMKKVSFIDQIRGKLEMAENDQDIVIIKSDGLPTYHLAHAADDHFMRITLVIRGEEWIPSTGLHLELFKALGFEQVKYAHVPTIMVNDGNSRRKLSKRKDKEAATSFFEEEGYPVDAILEYLLTVINSDYEPWRRLNPSANIDEFRIRLSKINSAGALFDMAKLIDISKNLIGKMSSEELLNESLIWAKKYNMELLNLFEKDLKYAQDILAIERDNVQKVRKDFAAYKDILPNIFYFYNNLFDKDIKNGYDLNSLNVNINKEKILEILNSYIEIHKESISKEKDEWFLDVKNIASTLGYATNMKEYKLSKDSYKGSIADFTGIIRIALTNRSATPDIYSIMRVLGTDEVLKRLKNVIK